MPRPISWQPRLRDIHRLVSESPRDPYHRADLEKLFRIGRRAAHGLLELMPRQTVGSSAVVERVDLLEFLSGAIDAEDLGRMLEQLRQAPPKPKRRKLRAFIPRDFEPGNLMSLPITIVKRRGEIKLLYDTPAELASLLYQLSTVIETEEFERRYCIPQLTPGAAAAKSEYEDMLAELEELEAEHAAETTRARR